MKFSVIIPFYEKERFLPRCLDSLAAQTDGDFEAIVVEDGRAEGGGRRADGGERRAEEIVSRYDERFRYIRHDKNRSAFQARRSAVAAATGDFIVPVDPDDYLLPETLTKLREVIGRENPDLISYRIEWDNGKKVWPHWCRHPNATVSGVEALRELTEHMYFTGVASKALRRETLLEALRELNAPDDFYANTCDDFLMLVPMLMKCEKVAFLDFIGYRYFVNVESTSFSWKTTDGFRRACEQTHAVGELVLRMARQDGVGAETRLLVGKAVSGIERWFVQMAAEGGIERWKEVTPILLTTLSSGNVASELVRQLTLLRSSRGYRLGNWLASALPRSNTFGFSMTASRR